MRWICANESFAQLHQYDDPLAGITTAEKIGDADLRAQSIWSAWRRWLELDPEVARTWLASSGLAGAFAEESTDTSAFDDLDFGR